MLRALHLTIHRIPTRLVLGLAFASLLGGGGCRSHADRGTTCPTETPPRLVDVAPAGIPAQTVPIGGVFEVGVGTGELEPMLRYWEQFGFTVAAEGRLDAARARELYGVESNLVAVRLAHGTSDHGLVRVMQWDRPTNEGLGLRGMRHRGNRWGAMLTDDVLAVANHAELAKESGESLTMMGPFWDVVYAPQERPRPFVDAPVGVREFMLLRTQTRQFMFQRYNYDVPDYGATRPSPMQASQFTHFGLIVQDDGREALRFYDEVLGLLRVNDEEWKTEYETTRTGDDIFGIGPGEAYYSTNFDDPRSHKTDFTRARSGRLKIIRYPEHLEVEDVHALSRPGSLGFSLYTYRVADIDAYHQRVSASGATEVTAIVPNEFGERSFSFVAPDGYFWTLVSAANHQGSGSGRS